MYKSVGFGRFLPFPYFRARQATGKSFWGAQGRGPRARACPPCHWREHAERACVWERVRTRGSSPEDAIRWAEDCSRLRRNGVFEPIETPLLTGGSAKALRAIALRRFWRHLGRLDDGAKNGPFWAAGSAVGVAGHWRERFRGHFSCIFGTSC